MSINLQKGQKISLNKEAGGALSRVVMGLGWDAAKKGGFLGFGGRSDGIDLDASCLLFDGQKQLVDMVYFGQLRSGNGAVQHSGDNLTGEGDGDDESIEVHLDRLPDSVQALVFVVSNFTGQDFSSVNNAYCRLLNGANQQEIARYDLSAQGSHTAQIMAKIYRHNGEWKMHAIGENARGRRAEELLPQILPHL